MWNVSACFVRYPRPWPAGRRVLKARDGSGQGGCGCGEHHGAGQWPRRGVPGHPVSGGRVSFWGPYAVMVVLIGWRRVVEARAARARVRVSIMAMAMSRRESVRASGVIWWVAIQVPSCGRNQWMEP
jgi:hypothetical protein